MNVKCSPKFIHVIAVERAEEKVGMIHLSAKPGCALGKVISHNSKLELSKGDIAFFNLDNFNVLGIDADGIHGMLYEDAVMCSCTRQQLGCELKEVTYAAKPKSDIVTAPPGMQIPFGMNAGTA